MTRVWLEHATGTPMPAELLQLGLVRTFNGRDHYFEDVTDRPCPTITLRTLEVVIEHEHDDKGKP